MASNWLRNLFRFGGKSTVTVADAGTTILTDEQASAKLIVLTGALSAARTIQLPLSAGADWMVQNDCTGGFAVTVKGSSGTGPSVAMGERIQVVTDGTNFTAPNAAPPTASLDDRAIALGPPAGYGTLAELVAAGERQIARMIAYTVTPDMILGSKCSEYWLSTRGVTQAASLVSAWVGQVRGYSFVQAVGANQPTFTPGTFGVFPSVQFDGTTDYMTCAATLANVITAAAGSVYVIYRPISIALNDPAAYNNDGIISDNGGYLTLSANTAGGGGIQAGTHDAGGFKQSASVLVTPGTPIVATWRHKSGNIGVRKNSGAFAEAAAADTDLLTSTLEMGAGYLNTFFGHYDIGALVFCNADLTANEDADMLAWAAAWGGVTL